MQSLEHPTTADGRVVREPKSFKFCPQGSKKKVSKSGIHQHSETCCAHHGLSEVQSPARCWMSRPPVLIPRPPRCPGAPPPPLPLHLSLPLSLLDCFSVLCSLLLASFSVVLRCRLLYSSCIEMYWIGRVTRVFSDCGVCVL